MMIIAALVMTAVVTPAMNWFQPMQHMTPYKRRTVQNAKPEEELRILACIYDTSNVPSLINLLRTSNSSISSPISVFALQIVELVGRATSMMITHDPRKAGPRNPSHMDAEAEQIITALDEFELKSEGVRTLVMTARSSYSTMDADICNVAGEKRTALIIIPFHKQQTDDGEMEDINPDIRNVNEAVLDNAPCSVGILIDKGFSGEPDRFRNIVMLYLGGPDDREALSYARRMVKDGDTNLSVVRFIASFDTVIEPSQSNQRYVSLGVEDQSDKHLDEEYHLYVVGRGSGMESPLTSGLADWCDCPELGPIGDLLVTSEFESSFAVLIVQQYVDTSRSREGSILSSNSMSYGEEVAMRPSVAHSDGFESLRNWDHEALGIQRTDS